MKYFLTCTLLMLSIVSVCQQNDSLPSDSLNHRNYKKGWVSLNWVMALNAGVSRFQIEDLNQVVNEQIKSKFNRDILNYGVSLSLPSSTYSNFKFDSHVDLGFFSSNPIVQELNDSTRYFFRGYNLGYDNCKDLLPLNQNIDILFGLGFNAGWFTFGNWDVTRSNKINRKNLYRNPYFSPKISNEIRFILFNHLSISLRSELQLDVTNPKWYSNKNGLGSIGGFQTTGYNLHLTLGWADQY